MNREKSVKPKVVPLINKSDNNHVMNKRENIKYHIKNKRGHMTTILVAIKRISREYCE